MNEDHGRALLRAIDDCGCIAPGYASVANERAETLIADLAAANERARKAEDVGNRISAALGCFLPEPEDVVRAAQDAAKCIETLESALRSERAEVERLRSLAERRTIERDRAREWVRGNRHPSHCAWIRSRMWMGPAAAPQGCDCGSDAALADEPEATHG